MAETLVKIEIKKVIGPTPTGAAVLLGNDSKSFVIFIGLHEAAALLREVNNETSIRPLTHDLLQSVLLGFDLSIKQIVVTSIVDNAFCATLILEQPTPAGETSAKVEGQSEDPVSLRNEVRIDARPSDCFVLAKKNSAELYVTQEVFDQVQDFSGLGHQDEIDLGSILGFESAGSPFATEELLSLPDDFLRRVGEPEEAPDPEGSTEEEPDGEGAGGEDDASSQDDA